MFRTMGVRPCARKKLSYKRLSPLMWPSGLSCLSNFVRRITSALLFTFYSFQAVIAANFHVPWRERPLPQEVSLLSVWESACAPCCSATTTLFCTLFFIRILCDSMIMFSFSCFEHTEFNLFVSILDQSSLVDWCGDFARHR